MVDVSDKTDVEAIYILQRIPFPVQVKPEAGYDGWWF